MKNHDINFEILLFVTNYKYFLGRPDPFDALQTRRRLLNEMSVILIDLLLFC